MSKYKIELKWGIIFSVFGLLWMVLEKSLGWHDVLIEKHAIYTNFIAVPAIIIYILALLDKKNNFYDGQMNWKQGFVCGVLISVVVALLTPLAQYITHTFITPDYFDNAFTYGVENDLTSVEDAEKFFSLGTYTIMATIGALGMGVVTSAVVAIFTMTRKPKNT